MAQNSFVGEVNFTIKHKFRMNKKYSFKYVSENVRKVVKNLPADKSTAGEIPIKVLKSSNLRSSKLTKCTNETFTKSFWIFQNSDITTVIRN